MSRKKAVKIAFVDRDGVINKYPGNHLYVCSIDEFHMLPRAAEGIRALNDAGFKVVVCSNQAGVGKGLYTAAALREITSRMKKELLQGGARVDKVYYCVHRKEENCACRKPRPGMIFSAIRWFEKKGLFADLKRSFFIGDTITDIETGKAAGLTTILVFSGKEKPGNRVNWKTPPDMTCSDIVAAARICRQLVKTRKRR